MSLLRLIRSDITLKAQWRYQNTDRITLIKTLVADGTTAMILYRLMQSCRRWKVEPLAMLCNKLNAVLCQCVIGRGADFGPGFVLNHAQGIVINSTVRGGERIFIEHQVTIGAERNASPILGSDIFIGAGAKIIGEVRIGDGARIGANAVVIEDVEPYTTVVGVPARAVKRRSPAPVVEVNNAPQ